VPAVPDLVDQPARGTLRVGQALTQRPPGIHRGGALVDPAVLAASLHCAVDVPPAGGRLCSFLSYVPTASADPGRAADVDHMRTTSIPSNHGTFTKHLHIRRQSNRATRGGQKTKANVRIVAADGRDRPIRGVWRTGCTA
jgi:hypothetical protein